jgi:PAS domain S-box-containing protein
MKRFDFRELVERLPLVVYVDELDDRSSALYVSPQIAQLVGYSQEEWLADPDLFSNRLHPDDRERVLADIADRNAGSTGSATAFLSYRLIARDGRVVWIRDDEMVVADASGRPAAAHGYMQDVTDRRQDSIRLELLVGILQLAADETPPDEIVAAAADRLVDLFGDVSVSYVERREDGEFWIRSTTEDGAAELWDEIEGTPDYLERIGKGPIVVDDVAQEAWLGPVLDRLRERNIASCVDVPLLRNGELVGVLWFNSSRRRAWDENEVSVLVDVAGQLAIVLANADAREQRRAAELDLRNRDVILEAVSRSAEHFLKRPLLDDALVDLMRVLGEATAASGAWVFENVAADDGPPLSIRRAGWFSTTQPLVDDPRLGHIHPAPHFPRWAALLAAGEPISGRVRDLPPDEREVLELIDALSVVAVPIFVDGVWWGFIGFEDCVLERDWSAAETDALRAAAGLVAAAINRERAERALRGRDAILEAVSHGARELLAAASWLDAAQGFVRNLGKASGASRCYLFENVAGPQDDVFAYERFEWVAPGIAPQIEKPELQPLDFDKLGLTDFATRVSNDVIVAANTRDLSRRERDFFAAGEVRSVITVPIFAGAEWWGFMGFDDCVAERDWSPAEMDALRTAASLVGAAIERERSEAVLRGHEQKLRAVFDTSLDAIFITDDDRRYVDVNPAGSDLIGVSKRDLIGRRVDEFLPPQRLEQVRGSWDGYITGPPVREEWQTMRPDGTVIISEASARPNFVPGLHIAFMRDVTDRKRLEAELVTAQKLESLGRLAGGVAHDFNNLLTGITGYASLLLERSQGDAELTRDLGEIKRAAERAAELTKQLLAFGRRQVLKPRPLDLNAVVTNVAPLLNHLLGEDVELDLRAAPELGIVRADPGQLEQVIVNLAVNARDAMPSGGRLTIETRNADDGFVELSFADTGIGIDEETLSQIFEPFFTGREEGVGLGLASVYGIVRQSNGDVSVVSTPGEGATFTVRLPRVYEAPEISNTAAQPTPQLGSETILLVEDEDVVRDLTHRVLERHGYTVLACANGAEAVALAETHGAGIELLLTDVVMPGLHGYEVAEKVAASRPEIKILYMSGYAEEAFVDHPAVTASALIEKPFAVDVLARRVREALGAPRNP